MPGVASPAQADHFYRAQFGRYASGTQFALEKLKQHRARQSEERLKAGEVWIDNDLVFCSTVGGHLHTSRIIFEQFKALLKKAGLPDIRFYDLRHSSATMLLSIGVHPNIEK